MIRLPSTTCAALILLSLWAGAAKAQQAGPELRAQVLPRDFTTLAAEIGARIETMPFHDGDRFAKDQSLVSFDCSIQRAQAQAAQADLRAANMTQAADQRLLALKSIGKLEDALAGATVDKARGNLASAMAVLDKCVIKAPFNGRVVEQKARANQFVQPGQALLDILDDSQLELDFVVPSRWLTWLKIDHRFQVTLDENGQSYWVTLSRIGARIDAVSQTIKMTGTIEGQHPELVAGMSGRVLLAPPSSVATAQQ
jgi:RND family efflux transporter MFP subunit